MFTSVMMPQETFANDPATDPWATALCTLLSLGGSLPTGEVCCLPAQLIQACQGNPGTPVWPSLMSTYCAHHSELCRQALILCHLLIIRSPLDGSPKAQSALFNYLWWYFRQLHHIVWTKHGHADVNFSWKYCLSENVCVSTAQLTLLVVVSLLFSSALMKVEPCQAGWTILPSAPGCHTSDDSPPSVWTWRGLTVFFFGITEGIIVTLKKKFGRHRKAVQTDRTMNLGKWGLAYQD